MKNLRFINGQFEFERLKLQTWFSNNTTIEYKKDRFARQLVYILASEVNYKVIMN